MICGRVWICPVCAANITEGRKNEIALAMRSFPGTVFLSTFTLQHHLDNKLSDLAGDLKDVYRTMKEGGWWKRFVNRWGVVGSICSFEVTVSSENGWHPHLHTLFFSTKRVDELPREIIQSELESRFIDLMAKKGRYVMQNLGVEVEKGLGAMEDGDEALKLYVGKWGLSSEVAKSGSKTGRAGGKAIHYSPFQLLDLVADGDKQAAKWFIEYAKATNRMHQLEWSRGLRKKLGLSEREKTDEELAAEKEISDQVEERIVRDFWFVKNAHAQAQVINRCEEEGLDEAMELVQQIKRDYYQFWKMTGLRMGGYFDNPPPEQIKPPDGPGGP